MNGNPLVSVIIPAYNCEAFIERALHSVLRQTWQNVECIVVDDGSRDRTADVVVGFGDRVRYVRQDNAGASAARNRGISLATGDYIAFLDADDSWVPSKLALQVRVFQEHPKIALVYTRCRFLREGQIDAHEGLAVTDYDAGEVDLFTDFRQVFENPYLATSTVMVDAAVVRSVGGFDPSLVTAEDLDFYFNCCWGRRYACIRRQLVYKEEVEGSLGGGPRTYADNLFVIDRFCQRYPDFVLQYQDALSKQKVYIYTRWINFLLYHGLGAEARKVLLASEGLPIEGRTKMKLKSYGCHWWARLKGRLLPMKMQHQTSVSQA